MANHARLRPTILVIFGAGGDLTHRKLLPALYNLYLDRWMPEQFAILGVSRAAAGDTAFRNTLREGVSRFSRSGPPVQDAWSTFSERVFAIDGDANDPAFSARLAEWLARRQQSWGGPADVIFYLAVPPNLFEPMTRRLGAAGLLADRDRARIVIEKPFGHDLESARALNAVLTGIMHESQIYRIDHYLGKETVQNILAFRFANTMFEPIWNRRYIDHIQLTVAEQVGVEQRAGYYERAGALRDMVQNHLLQVLCHIAMEPPVTYEAVELRGKKADVLRAIRPIPESEVADFAVRGQYAAGTINGKPMPAYRAEPGVSPTSRTETYVALKLLVDNWRWQDVPFYLRTGKRLPQRVSEVCIHFRPVPHRSFPVAPNSSMHPNCLSIRILPNEGITLRFEAKHPGHRLLLQPVQMKFSYKDSFQAPPRDAYETLLRDVMLRDPTLFMRADEVESAWTVVDPVLRAWGADPAPDLPAYAAGAWGPREADELLTRDGRHWLCLSESEMPPEPSGIEAAGA